MLRRLRSPTSADEGFDRTVRAVLQRGSGSSWARAAFGNLCRCGFSGPPLGLPHTQGMRKQYHFRPGTSGLDAWDVERLVALVADVPIEAVALRDIAEIDTNYWFEHGYTPTVRNVVQHCRLMQEVDPSYPVVLDPDGGVMDGMHRVARALLEGRSTIVAKRLPRLPEPDFQNCRPEDLAY